MNVAARSGKYRCVLSVKRSHAGSGPGEDKKIRTAMCISLLPHHKEAARRCGCEINAHNATLLLVAASHKLVDELP